MLLIYLPAITPRSRHVFELIFKNELGIEYTTTTDIKIFESQQQPKINYSGERIGNGIFIKSHPLLFENGIRQQDVIVEQMHNTPVLFANSNCDIGFDIFAAVFYMVSRYEEYLPFTPDKHGRFKAVDSIAYKNNFLQYPVVNTWIKYFKRVLFERFPALQFQTLVFRAIVTYDIDIAYSFKAKGFVRSAGATAKDLLKLNFKNAYERVTFIFKWKDPWDVYDSLEDIIKINKLNSIFFFLMGDYSTYDKNIHHAHPEMTRLIKKISAFSEIGIHPSYRSTAKPEKIVIEKKRLEDIVDQHITKSRQHYLRFNLPGTYNQLAAAGITEDYSMGFADMPGFRAGICSPFYFYDLGLERSTSLKIFPVTLIDSSFLYYLKPEPAASLKIIEALINEVKKVEGLFISVWHNNTVSEDDEFKQWKWVHDEMVKRISVTS